MGSQSVGCDRARTILYSVYDTESLILCVGLCIISREMFLSYSQD